MNGRRPGPARRTGRATVPLEHGASLAGRAVLAALVLAALVVTVASQEGVSVGHHGAEARTAVVELGPDDHASIRLELTIAGRGEVTERELDVAVDGFDGSSVLVDLLGTDGEVVSTAAVATEPMPVLSEYCSGRECTAPVVLRARLATPGTQAVRGRLIVSGLWEIEDGYDVEIDITPGEWTVSDDVGADTAASEHRLRSPHPTEPAAQLLTIDGLDCERPEGWPHLVVLPEGEVERDELSTFDGSGRRDVLQASSAPLEGECVAGRLQLWVLAAAAPDAADGAVDARWILTGDPSVVSTATVADAAVTSTRSESVDVAEGRVALDPLPLPGGGGTALHIAHVVDASGDVPVDGPLAAVELWVDGTARSSGWIVAGPCPPAACPAAVEIEVALPSASSGQGSPPSSALVAVEIAHLEVP